MLYVVVQMLNLRIQILVWNIVRVQLLHDDTQLYYSATVVLILLVLYVEVY